MGKRVDLPSIAILLTLGLFGLASNWINGALWGINHLAFLGQGWMIAYVIISILIVTILFSKRWDNLLSQVVIKTHDFIFEKGIRPKVLITLLFTILFYIFRSETHFLGDGYNLLSVFGQGEKYIIKWVEYGSIFIIRNIQSLLGGYTRETMKMTCQIISILSGAIVIINIFYIAKQIVSKHQIRILVLFTLLFSGGILLFFGYVEYYPLVWVIATALLNTSLHTLKTGRKIWLVVLLFILGISIHMQILCLAPAVIYLVISKYSKRINEIGINYKYIGIISGGIFLFLLVITYVFRSNGIGSFFLPLFIAPQKYYGYSLFSIKHSLDIINIVFLMIPGFLFLLTLLKRRENNTVDSITIFLFISSLGSILFLLFIDPIFGIGRDWDLMSFTLLSPLLLLVRFINIEDIKKINLHIIAFIIISGLMTSSYVAANTKSPASIDRFESLLRFYEFKDETGWAMFAYYFLNNNQYERSLEIAGLMGDNKIRPDKTYHLLALLNKKMSKYAEAEKYYKLALEYKPYNPYFLNELGQVYLKTYKYELAVKIFKRAHKIDRSLSFILEGLGLAYIYLGLTDSALVVADNLFKNNPHSSGGHLLKMVIAISEQQKQIAKDHYIEYLKYGKQRSDYRRISERYGYLSVE